MRKTSLVTLLTVVLLALPLLVPRVHASEPPMSDPHTFWEASLGWGPIDADPVSAYDRASQELLFNSMQGLIAFNGESYEGFVPALATNVPSRQTTTITISNISLVNADPTGSQWTNGSTVFTCIGWVDEGVNGFDANDVIYLSGGNEWRAWTIDSKTGTSTITLILWRGSYFFNIRTNPTIYFYNETGAAVDTFNVLDAEYSLRRGLVQDQRSSPMWMFYKPLFDQMSHDYWTNSTAMNLARLIGDAIVGNQTANTLTINVCIRFPDGAFKQVLANTYGCIGSKEFSLSIGCWNDNLYSTVKYGGPFPDWWIDWSDVGSTPYNWPDRRYCGTGPYHVTLVDSVNQKSIMQKNQAFWQGWPAPGCNASLDTVEVDYVSIWSTRKTMFMAGFYDSCAVPRNDMFELLTNGEPTDPGIKTIKDIVPELSMDAFMFNFAINDQSPYIGNGQLPDGIPTNFFNDTHVRKAFAHAFNATQYGEQAYYSEYDYRKNWLIPGLTPDYYNSTISGYSIDYDAAKSELLQAIFNSTSVWASGFTFYLAYNSGDDARMVACYMIRDFFNTLSTYNRTGHPFTVNLMELPWSTYIGDYLTRTLPMSDFGWVADFPDADNFARSYMHSAGALAKFQSYAAANGWGTTKDSLVEQALLAPDGSTRQALYNQLAQMYYDDCPSFPIVIPHGRQWCWYWVKGWYQNALYPSTYYYTVWKRDDCWFDVSGPTIGVSDGIVNMRDQSYLISHFGALAPVPGQPPDPKWVGVYGANGCVDPYGDRRCNMRDISGCILHFNHKNDTGTP